MRSTERILTTHVGSLPRPDDLTQMIWSKADGEAVDEAALASRVKEAIGEAIAFQREAGVDIINDGELSKPGFSSYIYDRYTGFGHVVESTSNAADLNDFPDVTAKL